MEVWRRHLRFAEPDLIKIDAEGAESLIVSDLLSSGLRPRVVVLETHGEDRARVVRTTMTLAGYDLVDEEHGRRATTILTYKRRAKEVWREYALMPRVPASSHNELAQHHCRPWTPLDIDEKRRMTVVRGEGCFVWDVGGGGET